MKISTEGVLVLASANGIRNAYQDHEFDYDFPDGLFKLLEQHLIIALTTSEGDDLNIEFVADENSTQEDFEKEIVQAITLSANDKLLILSHAEFTQICSANGDSENYRWPIEKIESLEAGQYVVNIKVKNTTNEFEKYEAYFHLTFAMQKIENSQIKNEVLDLCD